MILALILSLLAAGAQSAPRPEDSILYNIAKHCPDPSAPDYCRLCRMPVEEAAARCGTEPSCGKTSRFYESTEELVAFRDRKMCRHAPGVEPPLHALVVPRRPVAGVEDGDRRPAGIWSFAWRTALRLAPEHGMTPGDVALAINPPGSRSQDQMHVHIVHLAERAREGIESLVPPPVAVEDLDSVWDAAERYAVEAGIRPRAWYGIVVVRNAQDTAFLVAATADKPEKRFGRMAAAAPLIQDLDTVFTSRGLSGVPGI